MNLKKIIIPFVALLAVLAVTPAQAEQQESIAIIDVSFDASLIAGDKLEVCATTEFACNSVPVLRTGAHYKAYNHGTIMADVIRANNPGAKLVLIEAGTSPTGIITGIQLAQALEWVKLNREEHNITKVSFSYNSGNGAKCTPASPGVRVDVTHNNIVGLVSSLKESGTTVFAASGNYGSGNRIDYPACIEDVVAVGSTLYRGSQTRSDIVVSGFTYTSNTIKSNVKSLQDSNLLAIIGSNQLRVGNTTSVATAIAAATN